MSKIPRKVRQRILLLGMVDSIHVARWLSNAVGDIPLEILVIPTSPHRRIHPQIIGLEGAGASVALKLRIHAGLRFLSLFVWVLDRPILFDGAIRGKFISSAIRKFQPDLIHIMETQNGGYSYLKSAPNKSENDTDSKIPVVLTLFGSDLFWFSKIQPHRAKLMKLMPQVDVLIAECQRDADFAKELGFSGMVPRFLPVSGGIESSEIACVETETTISKRNHILIKGYGGTWGLGHEAIRILSLSPEALKGKKVVVFSAGSKSRHAAKKFLAPLGIEYEIFPKFAIAHSQMLKLFKSAVIYIGFSKSDGLPASMLEAMSQGAYPIQTSTACTEDWFTNGISGDSIPLEDLDTLKARVERVLRDLSYLQRAQEINLKKMREFYSNTSKIERLTYDELLEK
jgi:glycosyltransferase involved in cell wall biosynthesis